MVGLPAWRLVHQEKLPMLTLLPWCIHIISTCWATIDSTAHSGVPHSTTFHWSSAVQHLMNNPSFVFNLQHDSQIYAVFSFRKASICLPIVPIVFTFYIPANAHQAGTGLQRPCPPTFANVTQSLAESIARHSSNSPICSIIGRTQEKTDFKLMDIYIYIHTRTKDFPSEREKRRDCQVKVETKEIYMLSDLTRPETRRKYQHRYCIKYSTAEHGTHVYTCAVQSLWFASPPDLYETKEDDGLAIIVPKTHTRCHE